MSLDLLIQDQAKPWLNIRVNSIIVDNPVPAPPAPVEGNILPVTDNTYTIGENSAAPGGPLRFSEIYAVALGDATTPITSASIGNLFLGGSLQALTTYQTNTALAVTWSGPWSVGDGNPTGTISWSRVGNLCTVTVRQFAKAANGSANHITSTVGVLPVAVRPLYIDVSTAVNVQAAASTFVTGVMDIDTSGTITLWTTSTTTLSPYSEWFTFQAGGQTVGLATDISVSYNLV